MQVSRRGDIPSVHSAVIKGIEYPIGTVKRFTELDALSRFLPEGHARGMSWVNLASGEELAAHRHGEAGILVVTAGTGEVFGDIQQPLATGDMVLIPAGALHGFRATGGGFWGITVQFSGETIYQDSSAPRVVFESDPSPALGRLLSRQAARIEAYRHSELMQLMDDDVIQDPRVREALLDCLQAWSDHFQLLLHLRAALTESDDHQRVAMEHLREEMGHNDNLRAQRKQAGVPRWDAVMQSSMSWFKQAMLSGSDIERTLLVHLVLESSGELFHAAAASRFSDMAHFRQHGEDDGAHAEYGIELLRRAPHHQLEGLVTVLDNGWEMMTSLCDRMACIAREAAGATSR